MTEVTEVDILILQGATFAHEFAVTEPDGSASDLSTVTAIRMQARKHISREQTLLDLSLEGGQLSYAGNVVTVRLSALETAALTFGSAVYDLEIEFADGTVNRVAHGTLTLDREVTR